MEVQIWLSEQDDVAVNPGDLTLMTEQGAVVLMGDAEEREAWLKKVAEAMGMVVKPLTPEYCGECGASEGQMAEGWHRGGCSQSDDLGKAVDEALFDMLRKDQTIHWMGKPSADA